MVGLVIVVDPSEPFPRYRACPNKMLIKLMNVKVHRYFIMLRFVCNLHKILIFVIIPKFLTYMIIVNMFLRIYFDQNLLM